MPEPRLATKTITMSAKEIQATLKRMSRGR